MDHGSLTARVIVTGVVDTESACDAVVWSAREARRRGCRIRLVTAFEEPLAKIRGSEVPAPRAAAEEVLDACADQARRSAPGVEVAVELVHGWPDVVLSEVSRDAELLVIGSRGLGRLAVALRGSVGIELAAAATVPLVVVRGPDPAGLPEAGRLFVVVGVDGSPHSRVAARFAAGEARRSREPLVVAHASQTPADDAAVTDLLAELTARNPDVEIRYRPLQGRPAAALAQAAVDARLLVVAPRGRGGFGGLVLGSVTQDLMRRAPCPLAIVPPRVGQPAE